MAVLVVVLVVVAVAALGYWAWKLERQRTEALCALAGELGLQFDPHPDPDHDEQYAQFEIFRRGHSRVANNTLSGAIDLFGRSCHLQLGDFRYRVTSSNGKTTTTTTHRFSYLIARPPWPAPALLVRPEGLFDKVKGALGFDDIDFESAEFSRRFWVQASDKRFAYDVLHPRMMELLLAEQPPMLDLEGGALCISDGRRRWDAAGFRGKVGFLRRFCELWPRHLLKDLEA